MKNVEIGVFCGVSGCKLAFAGTFRYNTSVGASEIPEKLIPYCKNRKELFEPRGRIIRKENNMQTSDFAYDLPKELIAQTPIADRSSSRLLVYHRATRTIEDRVFSDITEYLTPKDVLVRNNTRVLPARLFAHRADTGGNMEFLLLKRTGEKIWECLARPARRAVVGREYAVNEELRIRVLGDTEADGGK